MVLWRVSKQTRNGRTFKGHAGYLTLYPVHFMWWIRRVSEHHWCKNKTPLIISSYQLFLTTHCCNTISLFYNLEWEQRVETQPLQAGHVPAMQNIAYNQSTSVRPDHSWWLTGASSEPAPPSAAALVHQASSSQSSHTKISHKGNKQTHKCRGSWRTGKTRITRQINLFVWQNCWKDE